MTIFNCLRFETPLTWRARSPYLYLPGTGWPGYTPRNWILFSSPPTTRRATAVVFHPASTRVCLRSSSHRVGVNSQKTPFPSLPQQFRIYISQEQDGPVITPGTGFSFSILLRLTGSRWRYSTPLQRGCLILAARDSRYIWSG
jgi:hypothetical protein